MGRHQSEASAPSQRGVIAALVAGAIVVAGGAYALGKGTGSGGGEAAGDGGAGCTSAPLRVETTPEIADLVKTQLAAATKADPCHRYDVTGTRSSSVASRIRQGKAPDVWVADSTVWLDETTAGSTGSAVKADWVSGGSLAHSPVVLANPVKSKDKFSGELDSWSKLINKGGAIHLANPHLDTASRLAFLASRNDAPTTKDVEAGQRIILLSRFAATSATDLLAGVQDPTKSNTTRSEPFPLSEQALAAYAKSAPGTLAAVAPKDGTLSMDYPWVPAPDLSPELKKAADAGFRALTSAAAVDAFTKAGFRRDDDTSGPTIDGTEAGTIAALTPMAGTSRLEALRQWDVLKADARMLAIIDVSGSMTTVSKDTGGKTRAKVAQESLTTAVEKLPDGSEVGGWIFSTDKGGKGKDWAPIAPIARLDEPEGKGTHRDAIKAALDKFPSYISGDTGLYDTTAAAFDEMTKTYDPEYFNSVVIITDGKNDDPGGGLDLNQLLAHIKKGHDPARPVRIVTIGMGEADTKVLKTISAATGGTSYTANTSDALLTVFVQALLAREPASAS